MEAVSLLLGADTHPQAYTGLPTVQRVVPHPDVLLATPRHLNENQ